MKYAEHATDLYVLPENFEEWKAFRVYCRQKGLRYTREYSDVKDQLWFGKTFAEIAFRTDIAGEMYQYLRSYLEKRKDKVDNLALFLKKRRLYNSRKGIRVGDFIKLPDGRYTRVTYIWPDKNGNTLDIQTGGNSGSYYLGNGYEDYSGGLTHGVRIDQIEETTEFKTGYVWFFRNDYTHADNSVSYQINQRVFRLKDGIKHPLHKLI